MSYDEYWWGDPLIYYWKEEAYQVRERYLLEKQDNQSWMTGYYVLDAIATAFADKKNPHKYPPYPQLVETMDEALAEKRRLNELIAMRNQFLAVSKTIAHDKQDEFTLLGEPE